jgi:hypothetical protein
MKLIKNTIKNLLGRFGLNIYKSNKEDLENFIKKIFVHDLGYDLIRVGCNGDGGYLVPNILNQISYCFSPGVGGIVNFENDLQKRGIKCFLADSTVQDPSNKIEKYDFIKKNINIFNDSNNITLESWINQKLKKNKKKVGKINNLMLQMDIEGDEIPILLNIKKEIIKKFKIMIIEFHNFEFLGNNFSIKIYKQVFEKILKDFDIAHIHPNNCCGFKRIFNYDIPRVMEITFLRKDISKFKKKIKNKLPHALDFKCVNYKKDISLPNYFYK